MPAFLASITSRSVTPLPLEGDDVAGLQREHLLVATEAGTITQLAIETEADLLDTVLFGPRRRDALDPLHVAAMDEIHVADALPNRTQGTQQIVAKRLHVLVGPEGQPSPGKHDGRALCSVGVADPLAPSLEEGASVNDCRRNPERNAVAGRRDPGTAGLADIVSRCGVAHVFVAGGGLLDLLGKGRSCPRGWRC